MRRLKKFLTVYWNTLRIIILLLMLLSWFIGYYVGGFYGKTFDLASIWTGIGVLALDSIKHFVDSKYNSPMGEYPRNGTEEERN